MKIGDYLKQRLTGYGGNFADIFYAVILGWYQFSSIKHKLPVEIKIIPSHLMQVLLY